MGEESWPENVVRSKRILQPRSWVTDEWVGRVIFDGPRPAICADCGKAPEDGLLMHLKPEIYAFNYCDDLFYLERHIGVACGCAKKRGLISGTAAP